MPKKGTPRTTGTGTGRGRAAKKTTEGKPSRGGSGMEEGRPADVAMGGAPATATAATATTPTHDQIAQRAREIWERRGHPQGQDREIWLEAETILIKEIGGK
jgi:hypothetical protein